MRTLVVACAACLLALAGCGQSTEDVWGGYTEAEAKDILKDPQVKQEIFRTAPVDPRGPIDQLYPTNDEIDDYDLRKATVQGEEAWEYKRDLVEGEWCIYISKDPATDNFLAQVGHCYAG